MIRIGKYILFLEILALLSSCSQKEQNLEQPDGYSPTHYRVTVSQGAMSKASVDGSEHYIFQDEDRLYVSATGDDADKLYGFLHLISGAGTATAVFDGDLYCHNDFSPTASTVLDVTLIGPNDVLHTVTGGRVTAVNYGSSSCAATFADAVQQYSHFTASGHYGDRQFTLAQQSSFLRCAIKFSAAETPGDTEVTVKIMDGSTELRSVTVEAEEVGVFSWARFVAVFAGGTELSAGATLTSQQGSDDPQVMSSLNDGSASTLAANTYYNVTRSLLPIWDGFKITARADLSVTFNYNNSGANIKYSKDDGLTWNNYTSAISLLSGEELCLKGTRANYRNTSNKQLFTTGGESCYISGNMMSLLYGDSFESYDTLPNYAFLGAFKNATWIDVLPGKANTLLTASTLSERCYEDMFRGCTGLTLAPDLPATTLAGQCYIGMFRDCDYLTVAPVFPTGETPVTVADSCCFNMFRSCDRLTTIPTVLPATSLCQDCYREMFRQCGNITSVNVNMLPATNIAPRCYQQMFGDCSKLTNSPNLPADEMEEECYRAMFGNCKKLTSAPAINSLVLAKGCYYQMFYGCSVLASSPTLPAATLVQDCYYQMFQSCSALTSITCLATNISASKCTEDWVKSVGSSGTRTFTKAPSMEGWTTGNSGIPSGWTVVDYSTP